MNEKETNKFFSSVEVLRELKFQEQFITPNTVGFSLNSNEYVGKPIDLQNYSQLMRNTRQQTTKITSPPKKKLNENQSLLKSN